jgi:IS5 family transposase
MNFFSLGVEGRIKQDHYLIKLNKLIDWTKIEKELKGIHVNEINPKGGPKAYNNLSMFKAILLGQWHTLSDSGLEESLTLRLDFMVFTGFELGERVPDETTICRFRNKLIEKKLNDKLFQEINRQLEGHGIKVKKSEGSILDATIIASAARPNRI